MFKYTSIKHSYLWYLIGYITADGNLSKDGRHIDITSKDLDHLRLIKENLRISNKIGKKHRDKNKTKTYYNLQIGNTKFYRYLLSLGLKPKKSLNLESKYFNDFLRGVIDGDGNISKWVHKSNLNIQWCLRIYSASYIFLNWVGSEIDNKFYIKGKMYINKRDSSPIYILKYGKKSARIILNTIYYNNSLALARKRNLALECLQLEPK